MKTARLLLATLSLATLAACGTESITEPTRIAPPRAPAANGEAPPPPPCNGTIVVTTDSDGRTTQTCVLPQPGPLVGSGG